jgi:hypothetical protein
MYFVSRDDKAIGIRDAGAILESRDWAHVRIVRGLPSGRVARYGCRNMEKWSSIARDHGCHVDHGSDPALITSNVNVKVKLWCTMCIKMLGNQEVWLKCFI